MRTRIAHTRRRRLAVAVTAALVVNGALAAGLAALAAAAPKKGPSPVVIKARDDCDPLTFNAALGPDACVGHGDTTFDTVIGDLLADGATPKWRFSRPRHTVKHGRALVIRNTGGEFHTFTEVAAFGGGCVPDINGLLGLNPVPECEPEAAPGVPLTFVTTGIPAGQSITVTGLPRGKHRFECLVHPWMTSTITVK